MKRIGTRQHMMLGAICMLLPLSACNCEDDTGADPWELTEPWPDMALPPDMAMEPDLDMAPDLDLAPDLFEEPDLPPPPPDIPPEIPWEKEVVAEVPRSQALNDRTSLGVGEDGTVWLGYHPCDDDQCIVSWLAVAIDRPDGQDWTIERVAEQRGTFGLDVHVNEPWVAYLDEVNNQFRVARRNLSGRGPQAWTKIPMPVDFTGPYDGLDLTHDDDFIYVTFASELDRPVELFAFDKRPGADSSEYIQLSSLDVGAASAALERGLQADGKGNLFLVHREGDTGPYGVARFRLRDNIWDRQAYFGDPGIVVSSMVARENGDICMSNTVPDGLFADGYLEMTCGKMNDLRRGLWRHQDESVSSYSSLIEGTDGSLIIAYNAGGNTELRVARRYPDGTWDIRTVFDGSSYGVSTALDTQNRLLISYYTCSRNRCTLELLRQPY